MQKDSFIVFKSFYDSLCLIEDASLRLELYDAIFQYGFSKEEKELSPLAKAFFSLIKPILDSNNQKYENHIKKVQAGKLGGAKKGNQNAKKTSEQDFDNLQEENPNSFNPSKENLTDTQEEESDFEDTFNPNNEILTENQSNDFNFNDLQDFESKNAFQEKQAKNKQKTSKNKQNEKTAQAKNKQNAKIVQAKTTMEEDVEEDVKCKHQEKQTKRKQAEFDVVADDDKSQTQNLNIGNPKQPFPTPNLNRSPQSPETNPPNNLSEQSNSETYPADEFIKSPDKLSQKPDKDNTLCIVANYQPQQTNAKPPTQPIEANKPIYQHNNAINPPDEVCKQTFPQPNNPQPQPTSQQDTSDKTDKQIDPLLLESDFELKKLKGTFAINYQTYAERLERILQIISHAPLWLSFCKTEGISLSQSQKIVERFKQDRLADFEAEDVYSDWEFSIQIHKHLRNFARKVKPHILTSTPLMPTLR